MIEIKNISHSYNENQKILDNISFNIFDGEFITLVGKSGCGKSTLLNIIAGYIKPTEGKILISEKEVVKPGKDRIVINQGYDHFDWMSVKDNIVLINKNNEVVHKLLLKVGLGDKHKSFPHELSGGMKKRLSIARALAADPKFLIMDEPFSSLDHDIRSKIYKEVLSLTKDLNKTVLLVTHDIDEAIELSDRIVVVSGKSVKIFDEIFLNKIKESINDLNILKNKIQKLIDE